ncbi:hypothetical protein [Arthrobacter sp. UYCo732]|uniref:hypothetical protein n=1 Tax=Arthrobacter sp. UYCo732 TaxID=3156336 RepID=UPI0033967B7E
MSAHTSETTTVDIRIATPLPSSVLLTLGALLDSAYPGAQLATNDEKYRDQVIFRVDNAKRQTVDDVTAADLRVEPSGEDLDIIALGPEGVRTLTPEFIADSFLPVIKAAFEMNPEAENYLEFTLIDKEDHHRYLLTFCKSAHQTPHELRKLAEQDLADARGVIHRQYAAAIYGLLGQPRAGRPDTYEAGVKAALDAVRQLGFPYTDDSSDDEG